MTPAVCTQALQDLPATLAKLKAARADCENLVKKLCTDIGPDTKECKMVTDRTPAFPAKRCKQMLDNYDKVLEGLRTLGYLDGGPATDVSTLWQPDRCAWCRRFDG